MPANTINKGESLAQSYPKVNQAIIDSYEALNKSTKADKNSNEALVKAKSVQTQLNTIVVEGDSSPAADQARVGANDTVHNTLKERLDEEYNQLINEVQQAKDEVREYVVNVRTPPYNAKGDGVTDDSPIYQRAIDDIAAKGGGTLFIPDTGSEYFFKDGVRPVSYTHLTLPTMAVV